MPRLPDSDEGGAYVPWIDREEAGGWEGEPADD